VKIHYPIISGTCPRSKCVRRKHSVYVVRKVFTSWVKHASFCRSARSTLAIYMFKDSLSNSWLLVFMNTFQERCWSWNGAWPWLFLFKLFVDPRFFFSATTTRSFCLTTATWRSDRISWTVSGATRNADSASSSRSCFHRCVCRLLNTFPLVALDRVNILVRLFFLGRILFGDDYLTKAKTAERQIAQCQISRRRNGDAKSSHGVFSQHPPADFFSRRRHKAAQYSLILVCTSSHYLKKMCGLIDLFEEARYLNKTCTSSNHRKKEARAQSADSSKAYSKPKAFNSRALCFPTTRR